MKKSKKYSIVVTFVAALLGLFLGWMSTNVNVGYPVETFPYDTWFQARYALFGPARIDSRLMLVGIDEPTVQYFGKPKIFWSPHLAELIGKVKEGNPAAVGLDVIIAPSLKGMPDDDVVKQRLFDEALQLALQVEGAVPVVFIEAINEGYLSDNSDQTEPVMPPHEVIVDYLTDQDGNTPKLAIANVGQDRDGSARRGVIYDRKHKPDGKLRAVNFSLRLLEEATKSPVELQRDAQNSAHLKWKDIRVPVLFLDSFMINFPGPTEDDGVKSADASRALTFPTVSAKDVLTGKISPETFKDKIVIVAPTTLSLLDEKVVPGDPQYHGAAIHLSIINMFLTNQFIRCSYAFWILWSAGAALLGLSLGRAGRMVAGLLGVFVFPLTSFLLFAFFNVWLACVYPVISFVAAGFLGYLQRLLTVERDRAKVRSTFARMVSPQVMNHVLSNYSSLTNGERKELTVLFSDINNFTPICEQHTPEEVIAMLSEYFSLMVDVIMKYDGYLKQYVGDEIMVIFGAPEDSSDHATRAVLTALEMRDVLKKAKETSGGKPGFYEVKIGINTGSVVVGKVGPESRWEYAAVGDDVNLGARVMSAAQKMGMDIGVSAASKERFEKEMKENPSYADKVKWISKGVQSFKGKISQMEVFAIERDQ